jgi:hypothetical protein
MKIIILIIGLSFSNFAQQFTVKNITGDVKILSGASEEWKTVQVGQQLIGSDLLLTDEKSSIRLNNEKGTFLINNNIAVGLKNIRKVSLNDLVLALALEDIRNVPKKKQNGNSKNTAVYGSEENQEKDLKIKNEHLGFLKLNGAKFLHKNGFTESAIIVGKEVFRNFPSIANSFEDRLYFADLLNGLKLYQEAASDYSQIQNLNISDVQKSIIEKKKEELSVKLLNK